MNRGFLQICLIISLTIGISSCFDPPEYSNVPSIKFKKLEFVDVDGGADSLRVTFDFKDGNGDIGLDDNDVLPPYHTFNVIIDSDNKLITYDTPDSAINLPLYVVDPYYGYGSLYSETLVRPEFNCQDYYFDEDVDGDGNVDTIFVQRNEYHSNLYIDFLKKRNGQFVKTTIAEEFNIDDCNQVVETLRIPIFDRSRVGKPTTGSITYAYVSNGLTLFLAQDTFKLRFYIYDRGIGFTAPNKSNVVETRAYTLSEVLK